MSGGDEMKVFKAILIGALVAGLTPPAIADRYEATIGGDRLVTGDRLDETEPAARDVLASGAQVSLRGDVAHDLLAAGFDVDVQSDVTGDVTVAGARVQLDGSVAGDVTASGFLVSLEDGAAIGGNARVFAGSATHRGNVAGALIVMASEVRLDGVVEGDARIAAQSVSFGPDARIDGRLTLVVPSEIDVPSSVIPGGRVSYEFFDAGQWRNIEEFTRGAMPEPPSAATVGAGSFIGLAFLLIIGGLFLVLAPRKVATMRRMALARPGITILIGAVGFSTLVGFVPVSAMTLVGLPFLPFAILLVLVGWLLGYLLGAYVVAMGVARAVGVGDNPSTALRLGILAAAIVVAALLNFIPILGWVLNIALVFLGLGAITEGVLRAIMPSVDPAEDDETFANEEDRKR